MSLQATKDQLNKLLGDTDNKVIALSGKWGTGKTHLWREVRNTSQNKDVKNALYVSLFGLSDIGQVKLKIVQSTLLAAEKQSAIWDLVSTSMKGMKKILSSVHKGFSAIDDFSLLAVPIILKDKIIVLDDIERKHKKLGIDEVLGFIDEYTQGFGSRFVLILNSDKLAKLALWNTLRERVIDREIRLNTSPAEAFDIAIELTPSPYADNIKKVVETCEITNIRIVCRIIKAVNCILGDREKLSEAVLARVIPTTAVLSAIHYKGIEDGPDFEFVLSLGTPSDWSSLLDDKENRDAEGQRKAQWKLMLNELGIMSCDDYELLVVEFLQSGLFDVKDISAIIDRYVSENDVMVVRNQAIQLQRRIFWDHKLSETELLEQSKELMPKIHLIDEYTITDLVESVSELPDGKQVSELMIDKWIEYNRNRSTEDISEHDSFLRPLHQRIRELFVTVQATAHSNLTVYEACSHIAQNNGWGTKQELVMKSATVEDFENTIRTLDVHNLIIFMRKMLELCIHKQEYIGHFGSAMDHFTGACIKIAQDTNSARLGKLIRNLFDSAKLSVQLDPNQNDKKLN